MVTNKDLTTKTTTINGTHYVRLFDNDKLHSEMGCKLKEDIGYCCRELLRWYDKLGGNSKMASDSRHRNKNTQPKGKTWLVKIERE